MGEATSNPIIFNLRLLIKLRRWNYSNLARQIGVSRQAVAMWFNSSGPKATRTPMSISSLLILSKKLGLKLSVLIEPFPGLSDPQWVAQTKASLLWDQLYEDMTSFVLALYFFEEKAVARYVQVYGLYPSANILGNRIWKDFDHYKKHLHPTRRNECEKICQIRQNLKSL